MPAQPSPSHARFSPITITVALAAGCSNLAIVKWLLTDPRTASLVHSGAPVGWACYTGRVEIARLLWGAAADPPPAGPWQLILGSDLTYAGAHAELAATLATLLLGAGEGAGAPMPPRVVLSHEHRKRPQGVQVEGWTDCDNTLQTFAEVRPGHLGSPSP